jgi:hypothetical protein
LNVLYAAAEVAPYSKVGGLADVAASLPKALRALGHDARVIAPAHGGPIKGTPAGVTKLPALGGEQIVSYRQVEENVYLVVNERYFGERQVYGEPDDLLRYYLFALAVLEAPRVLGWKPDVIRGRPADRWTWVRWDCATAPGRTSITGASFLRSPSTILPIAARIPSAISSARPSTTPTW